MTQFISEDDMNQTVQLIVQTFQGDIEAFRQACQIYGSDFFDGEDPVFSKKLATALKAKFNAYTNNFWDKLAGE